MISVMIEESLIMKAESSQLGVYSLAIFLIYRWFGEGLKSNIYIYILESRIYIYYTHIYCWNKYFRFVSHRIHLIISISVTTLFENSPLDARTNLRSAWDKIRVPVGPPQGGLGEAIVTLLPHPGHRKTM